MLRTKFLAAIVLLFGAVSANATTISFDLTGTCLVSCDRFGLEDGDDFAEIGALVFAAGTSTAAGATFGIADIVSFSLFGIDFLTGNTRLFSIDGPSGFVGDDEIGGFILTGGLNAFCYNFEGRTCTDGDFDTIVGGSDIAAGGSGHGPAVFTRTAVPAPATLALLGLGLAGLGFARRR